MNIIKSIFSFVVKYHSIITLVLSLGLGILCYDLYHRNGELEASNKVASKRVTMATKVLDTYKDPSGGNHLVIENTKISEDERKKLLNTGYVDTLATAFKIAKQTIKELTVINAQLNAMNLKGTVAPGQQLIRHTDEYADISYNPVDTTFGLKYNIKLVTAGYQKKTGFLNLSRTNVLDLYSPDKRVSINGVERFSVEVPDPNFGMRGQVKAQYNFKTKSISPAMTIEANYKSYTAEANMFYNLKDKTFTPTIGIKKDLFRIK
jgi:hypothetical protein